MVVSRVSGNGMRVSRVKGGRPSNWRERERERVDIVCVCISVCVFRVALIGLCFVRGAAGGCPTGTSSPVRVYYSNVEQISVVDTPHQL